MAKSFYDNEGIMIYLQNNAGFASSRAKQVHDFILKNNLQIDKVLDLACGTGNFLSELQVNASLLEGLDISSDMINYAKRTYKNEIVFNVADMVNFTKKQKYNLITCNYDAINHLSSNEDLLKMLKNVYEHLENNGLFIFDFNSEYKVVNNEKVFYESYENFDLVNKLTKINNKLLFETTAYIKEKDKYLKQTFSCTETIFSNKEFKKMLKLAGFADFVFCDENLNKTKAKLKRYFVIAKK